MECMRMLESAEKNNNWLQRNFEKLQGDYPNKFIAISNEKIIAESSNSSDIIEKVEEKGENPANVLIEFIPEKGLILIL